MIHYLCTDIEWDTDGEFIENRILPDKVVIRDQLIGFCKLYKREPTDDEVEETLSDMLTETYGFCHFSFRYEPIDVL